MNVSKQAMMCLAYFYFAISKKTVTQKTPIQICLIHEMVHGCDPFQICNKFPPRNSNNRRNNFSGCRFLNYNWVML